MARPEKVIHVRLNALAGLAGCTVCDALLSFKLSPAEFDRISELRCPACGGSCEPFKETFVLDIMLEPPP